MVKSEWMSSIMSNIRNGIILTDRNGNVTYVNAVVQSILELSEIEYIGKPAEDLSKILDKKYIVICQPPFSNF